MKTTENTILITGGTSGIGFEIAKLFSASGNKVIIVGRNKKNLNSAISKLTNVSGILGDINNQVDVENMVEIVRKEHPQLNILVNNAGMAILNKLDESFDGGHIAEEEMRTNFFSVIRLNQFFLPLLSQKKEAAIINVSSVVAIVPGLRLATYSASKSALHSYTLSLRSILSHSHDNVKVFEIMPPLVNTKLSSQIGGENGISPTEVAQALLEGMISNNYEIHVGLTQYIYDLYLKSPEMALQAMNPPVKN